MFTLDKLAFDVLPPLVLYLLLRFLKWLFKEIDDLKNKDKKGGRRGA